MYFQCMNCASMFPFPSLCQCGYSRVLVSGFSPFSMGMPPLPMPFNIIPPRSAARAVPPPIGVASSLPPPPIGVASPAASSAIGVAAPGMTQPLRPVARAPASVRHHSQHCIALHGGGPCSCPNIPIPLPGSLPQAPPRERRAKRRREESPSPPARETAKDRRSRYRIPPNLGVINTQVAAAAAQEKLCTTINCTYPVLHDADVCGQCINQKATLNQNQGLLDMPTRILNQYPWTRHPNCVDVTSIRCKAGDLSGELRGIINTNPLAEGNSGTLKFKYQNSVYLVTYYWLHVGNAKFIECFFLKKS